MANYIFRRLILAIPLLVVISFLAFLIFQLSPGNYFDQLRMNPDISQATIQRLMSKYHFDKPVWMQFLYWLKGALVFDFGYSLSQPNVPVMSILTYRLGNTLILSISSFLLTWLLAIPLAILCVLYHGRFWDKFLRFSSFIGISTPSFFIAMLLLWIASRMSGIPIGGMHSLGYENWSWHKQFLDLAIHLVVPTITLVVVSISGLMRILRANMLEVLNENYIQLARAKGLSQKTIFLRHVLPNAMNPLISLLGLEIAGLFSGAALIEIIFNWPGLGSLLLEATRSQDVFLVMGNIVIIGWVLIIGNLLADILLVWVDPRIRFQRKYA